MQLYNLGKVGWQDSQLIYHALAELGREALVLVSPTSPYVCIGFFQDMAHEVDVGFCQAEQIPIFRREVGGGAVYLDGDQLFFQLVLHPENPLAPAGKEAFYRKFLQPVINVYRQIGVAAQFRPVNDIVAAGRKISGTGVGEIGKSIVLVGNLIFDFNYEMLARVLKVPDEKFRGRLEKTMAQNLSTVRREVGETAAARLTEERLNSLMAAEFQKLLGPLKPAQIDAPLRARMQALEARMTGNAWLYRNRRPGAGRAVRIRAGLTMVHRIHKAAGGLMRADFELREDKLTGLAISGDFFCYPARAIRRFEKKLEGLSLDAVKSVVEELYADRDFEIPGVRVDDWVMLLKGEKYGSKTGGHH